jgi:hypothetical protein
MALMTTRPKREGAAHDFTVIARRVVEQAIGERLDGSPLDRKVPSGRVSAARRVNGRKGGPGRAKKLTAAQRSEIARVAAEARWKKSR